MFRKKINRITVATLTGVLSLLLLVVGLAWALWREVRHEAIQHDEMERLAYIEHASASLNRVISGLDVLLSGSGYLLSPALRSDDSVQEMVASELLRSAVAQHLIIKDMLIVSPEGSYVAGVLDKEHAGVEDVPRELLRLLLQLPYPEIVVSEPVVRRGQSESSIFLGRSVQPRKGVRWVVLVEVQVSVLSGYLIPLTDAPSTEVVLEDRHGHILAASPGTSFKPGQQVLHPLGSMQVDGTVTQALSPVLGKMSILARKSLNVRGIHLSSATHLDVLEGELSTIQRAIWIVAALLCASITLSGGLIRYYVGRLYDLKAREQTTLKTMEQAIESIGDGFLLTDSQDDVLAWNQKYIEYLPHLGSHIRVGLPVIELIRLSARVILPQGNDEEIEQWVQWRMSKRMEGTGHVEFFFPNGQTLVFTDRRTPDGGVVCVLRDVTQLKKVESSLRMAKEEAEGVSAAKTDFLATMSHEIRTPMNGIMGMAQMLSHSRLSESETRSYARVIWNSGQSMLNLLNDLLDVSRIESGKLQLDTEIVKPAAMLEEVLALYEASALDKGLSVQIRWAGRDQDAYVSDPQKIRQMLSNLVSNAVKFTDKGQIRIEAQCKRDAHDKSWLEFSVTDTGVGLSTHEQEVLFKPYSRVLNPKSGTGPGGSGLGLSIVKGYATAMGGDAGVSSRVGYGSRFWFRIPVHPAESTDSGSRESMLSSTGFPSQFGTLSDFRVSDGASLRVLVVDDNEVNKQVASLMLRKMGIQVLEASDGREALECMKAEPRPDLVFMDCMMPGVDGFEATRSIREWERTLGKSHITIVALTARAYESDKIQCQEAGMDGFLTKPVEIKSLQEWIGKFAWQSPRVDLTHGSPDFEETRVMELALFDEVGLLERLEGDRAIAQRVVQIYLNDMPHYIEDLLKAAKEIAREDVVRLAHVLAGASANVSAQELSRLAKQLENWAQIGAWSDVASSMEHLNTLSLQTRAALEQFVDSGN